MGGSEMQEKNIQTSHKNLLRGMLIYATRLPMSLKTIIDAQGRKQAWIAEKLGIPPSTFHAIVHERLKLPADQVEPLASLLGVKARDILQAVSRPESA